jgi:hypothetical protein
MSTTLPDILTSPTMLGIVEKVRAGLPRKHLPPALFGGPGITRRCDGNKFGYFTTTGNQSTDPFSQYGAKSTGATPDPMGEQTGKTFTSSRNIEMKAADMKALMSPEGQRQVRGEFEVGRQLGVITTRRENTRTAAITSAILLGSVYLNGEGHILPSSSGAVTTVAMPTQATYTKSASWQTATTDILGDLGGFQAQSLRDTGRELRHAVYGSRVLHSLMTNTNARDLVARALPSNTAFQTNAPSGLVFEFAGLIWWPGQFGFFKDSGGTKRTFLTGSGGTYDQDTVVFMPEVTPDWYELIEGTTDIPGSGGTIGDASALWNGAQDMQGMFQYAEITTDPFGVKVVYGDNFFPLIKAASFVGVCDTV